MEFEPLSDGELQELKNECSVHISSDYEREIEALFNEVKAARKMRYAAEKLLKKSSHIRPDLALDLMEALHEYPDPTGGRDE